MIDLTVTLKAEPELLSTLNKFADALLNTKVIKATPITQPVAATILPQPNPVPAQIPAQPVQQQAIAPTTPIQPVPVQQQFTPQPQVAMQPQPAPIPTAIQSYTMDQLALGATQLMDAGHLKELQQLLATFGVQALTQLPKEQYGAFATKLREMGAKL